MLRPLLTPALLLALAAAAPSPANAQLGKNAQIRSAFGDVGANAAKSTVRVYCDGKEVALGVVLDRDGWILTKHSVLKGDKITCKTADGDELTCDLRGHDTPYDVALLKTDEKGLSPIQFCDSKICKVGHWVVSPDTNNKLVALGVLSVASRDVKNSKAQMSGPPKAWLGVAFDTDYAGVKIQETVPKSPAAKAGIKANDVILKINGEEFQSAEEFAAHVGKFPPGAALELKIERDEKEIEIKVKLAERPRDMAKGDVQNSMGSKLSDRRGGFPTILTHDSVIRPEDCGGPLVNIEGKVIGINICRAGRTESFAIPAEVLQPLIAKMKAKQAK